MLHTILLAILTHLLVYYLYKKWTYKGPPHVTGLPLVGYLPFLGKEPYLKFHELMAKHGPIFSLYMGSHYAVILNNYDVVREAFIEKGNVFNARPPYMVFKLYDHEMAFSQTDGETWKVIRNFSMNTLRHLGFGKNFTENFVQMEIRDLISELKSHKGKPTNVDDLISRSITMLILSLVTGKRYDRSDHTGWPAQITTTARELLKSYSHDVGGMLPWVRKLPFADVLTTRKTSRNLKERLWSLIDEELRPLKKTYSPSAEPDNFVHTWYQEQEKRNNNNDLSRHLFSDFSLKNNLDLLIQGSADTTSTTLLWALLYLILYQDIQDKLHREINEVIGYSREPTLDDAKNMHYTKAFLLEVHRKSNVVPLGVFHSNKVQDTIKGYRIPKDTMVISNLWSIHHDPERFPDPYTFNPERFLDENRKFRPCEHLGAFSFGRRICPGKQVAEMQLFLYLTSILQAFQLRAPSGPCPSIHQCCFDKGIVRRSVPYEIIFAVRNQ